MRERDRSVSRGRITTERITSPLSGLCYCDSCGAKMKMQKTPENKSPYSYRCGLHVRYGKSFCTSHNIKGTVLENVILADIKRQIDFVTNDDKARAKYLVKKRGNMAQIIAEENKRRQEIQKRLDDLVKLMQKIYEDRVLGNMPDKACAELLDSYQNEKEVLQTELNELKKRADGYKREEDDVDEFIRRLKSYAGAEELTRQMCLELIEYVTIDKYVDKNAQRDVHIYYKLIDKPLRDKTNALA